MARVTHVKKAQKGQGNCRRCGHVIIVGEPYYWLANRIGRSSQRKVFCDSHPPRPSDTTTSDKLSTLYAAQESFSDNFPYADVSDIASALRDVAQAACDTKDEYQNSFDNMPEKFQESSGIQEKIDACESWESACNDAADEIEGEDAPEKEEEQSDEDHEKNVDEWLSGMNDKAQEAVDSLEL